MNQRPLVFALPDGRVAIALPLAQYTAWLLVDQHGGTNLALGMLSADAVELHESPPPLVTPELCGQPIHLQGLGEYPCVVPHDGAPGAHDGDCVTQPERDGTWPTPTPESEPHVPETAAPEHLTTKEVATIFRTSPSTVRFWRHQGRGPAGFRVGRRVLYRRDEVERWAAAQQHQTVEGSE
jgi:excisionase family DNA binding protein